MCGIAGVFHPGIPRDPARLEAVTEAMIGALAFRGPDHLGTWADAPFGGGTARLRITGGRSKADQPLVDERGRVFIFNGELYDPGSVATRLGVPYDPSESDGTVLARLNNHSQRVSSLAFTPDGTGLLSASWDGDVRLWGIEVLLTPAEELAAQVERRWGLSLKEALRGGSH